MTDGIGLAFLPNPGGEAEGLSDAGVETFRDKPFAAVARETGQNSRDARDNLSKPVIMTFDKIQVNSGIFPDIDAFRSAAGLCLQKARRLGKEKDIGFFTHAVRVLEAPEIDILRISDYNTKGVRGPCEEGRPFHTLAKADGVTDKDEIDSGGSFGIGKNSVFALSDIQTAFFSTIYEDEAGEEKPLCIGKTLFVSHVGSDGKEKRRKGYWGKLDGFLPLDDADTIPEWMRRTLKGTSIFSICMRQNPTDWRYEMAAALLINFFVAIERNEMEFKIDNGFLRINRNTIQSLFSDEKVNEAVNRLKSRAAFDAARTLHTVLVDEATITNTLTVPYLGQVRMQILLREGLGYSVGIVRNGMYITDNFANFNEPFKRFPLHQEFAVVIEPSGKTEGEWFKRVEGPKHNDLSAERITDPELREKGESIFSKLAKKVRDTIRAHAKSNPTTSLALDELNDLFSFEDMKVEDDEGLEKDPRSYKPTHIRPAPPSPTTKSPRAGVGDVPGLDPGASSTGSPSSGARRLGPASRKGGGVESIHLEKERTIIPDPNNFKRRRIFFTPPISGVINVCVKATGLSEAENLRIVSSNMGELTNGAVTIVCKEGSRVSLDVEFEANYTGAIELSSFLESGQEAEE